MELPAFIVLFVIAVLLVFGYFEAHLLRRCYPFFNRRANGALSSAISLVLLIVMLFLAHTLPAPVDTFLAWVAVSGMFISLGMCFGFMTEEHVNEF